MKVLGFALMVLLVVGTVQSEEERNVQDIAQLAPGDYHRLVKRGWLQDRWRVIRRHGEDIVKKVALAKGAELLAGAVGK